MDATERSISRQQVKEEPKEAVCFTDIVRSFLTPFFSPSHSFLPLFGSRGSVL